MPWFASVSMSSTGAHLWATFIQIVFCFSLTSKKRQPSRREEKEYPRGIRDRASEKIWSTVDVKWEERSARIKAKRVPKKINSSWPVSKLCRFVCPCLLRCKNPKCRGSPSLRDLNADNAENAIEMKAREEESKEYCKQQVCVAPG